MDPFFIWAFFCSALAVVFASETREKRDLNLLQNIFSGISRKCRYKAIEPQFRSYNIEDFSPQYVNLLDHYKISQPNFVEQIGIEHLNDRRKDMNIVKDTQRGQFGQRKLCFCEEKDKTAQKFSFGRIQKVNRNNPFYYRNYLARANLQSRYNKIGINRIPFSNTHLQKVTQVSITPHITPFFLFDRNIDQQVTDDNTNEENYRHKYSYKQSLGDFIKTYTVDKNGDVLVTETKKSLTHQNKANKDKDSLSTNSEIKKNSKLSDPYTQLKNNSIILSENILNSGHLEGYSQKKYFHNQAQLGLAKSYSVDKNGDGTITETTASSSQITRNKEKHLNKFESGQSTNNKSKNKTGESESFLSYQNSEQTNGEYSENLIFTKPISSRYTYKQINHDQPNTFTVVKVESPQQSTLEMTNIIKEDKESLLGERKNKNFKEWRHNALSFQNKDTLPSSADSKQNEVLESQSGIPAGYVYIPPFPNTSKSKEVYNKNNLNYEMTTEIYKDSVSSKTTVVNLSENPIIVKESPSYKYIQVMDDTATVIKADEGNVSVTIEKATEDSKYETSQNNVNRGDVPEY